MVEYFKPQPQPQPQAQPADGAAAAKADSAVLRVLFASRGSDRNTTTRLLLNEQDLLQRCNEWKPPGGSIWSSASCSTHRFGQDMLVDMALARWAPGALAPAGSAVD